MCLYSPYYDSDGRKRDPISIVCTVRIDGDIWNTNHLTAPFIRLESLQKHMESVLSVVPRYIYIIYIGLGVRGKKGRGVSKALCTYAIVHTFWYRNRNRSMNKRLIRMSVDCVLLVGDGLNGRNDTDPTA